MILCPYKGKKLQYQKPREVYLCKMVSWSMVEMQQQYNSNKWDQAKQTNKNPKQFALWIIHLYTGKNVCIWLYHCQFKKKQLVNFWNACYRNSSRKCGLNFQINYAIARKINQSEIWMWCWYCFNRYNFNYTSKQQI